MSDMVDFLRGGIEPCPIHPGNIARLAFDPSSPMVVVGDRGDTEVDGFIRVIDAVKIASWLYVVRLSFGELTPPLVGRIGWAVSIILREASQFATADIEDMRRCGGIEPITVILRRSGHTWHIAPMGEFDGVQRIPQDVRGWIPGNPEFTLHADGYLGFATERQAIEALSDWPLVEFKRLAMQGGCRVVEPTSLLRAPIGAAAAVYDGSVYLAFNHQLQVTIRERRPHIILPPIDHTGSLVEGNMTVVRRTADGLLVDFQHPPVPGFASASIEA